MTVMTRKSTKVTGQIQLQAEDDRLSPDQKKLVSAFNVVANYFKDRLLRKAKTPEGAKKLGLLVRDSKGEQANSAITDETALIFEEMQIKNYMQFKDAIKLGGTLPVGTRYYVEEVFGRAARSEKEQWAEKCRMKILFDLLVHCKGYGVLPHTYIDDQFRTLGFDKRPA